jgi:hypothetical protein
MFHEVVRFPHHIIYHVKLPQGPLSLKQWYHAEIFKGKEKIDITEIPRKKTIPRSITLPRYYKIIMLTNPLKLSDQDE